MNLSYFTSITDEYLNSLYLVFIVNLKRFFCTTVKLLLILTPFHLHSTEATKTLPFHLDASKRISDEELAVKKEGSFITGVPGYAVDPITGTWLGGSLYYTENGKKKDPLFEYAPYKYKISTDVYQSLKSAKYYTLGIDLPYINNTPFRLNTFMILESNPNAMYFGIGESSMNGLSYNDRNDSSNQKIYNANYEERQRNLSYRRKSNRTNEPPYVTDTKYNEYETSNNLFSINVDRTFLGKYRFLTGVDLSKIIVNTYDGKWFKSKDPYFSDTPFPIVNSEISTPQSKTKLTEDYDAGKINGYHGGYVNYAKVGIAYDTRDFEVSPRKGIFAEAILSSVSKYTGSTYTFYREFFQIKVFQIIFPKTFEELVIAGRIAGTRVTGNVPFTEFRYMYSMDGPIIGLGGMQTLRGFKQDRFVGNIMGFGNLELRYRIIGFTLGEENFTISIVPSIDVGRVWDKTKDVSFKDYMYSKTLGLRIIWNQSTVISMDYGRSREDSQFFLDIGQTF